VLSSRIEGMQATLGEVLEFEAEGAQGNESTPKETDIHESGQLLHRVVGGKDPLGRLPLSQRLLKETHRVLMRGARGRARSPGKYRRVPNWIGPHGCSIEETRFIPCPADRLPAAMSVWEKYLHADVPDRLVQLAMILSGIEPGYLL